LKILGTLSLYLRAARHLGAATVVERLRRLAIELGSTFGCESCGEIWPKMFPFMVEDELWAEVTGDEEAHLCIGCFEVKMRTKIGRSLLPEDLLDVPINRALLMGIRIAHNKEK